MDKIIKFPTLNETKVHYFDYGATSFMPYEVMNKWFEINATTGVFVGRGSSILTKRAESELKKSEKYFHDFFNISDEYENIYAKNVTEVINIVALAIEEQINILDMIVVGPFEHHSNYLIWREIASKRGALFCEIPIDSEGNLDYSFLDRYKSKIKVVSVSAVSNSFGYKIDIQKLCEHITEDIILLVDESQVTAHIPIETNDKISGYFIPSHKMYGPKNIAMASIKRTLINKMKPVILGGGMVENVGYKTSWAENNRKFFAGTMDVALIRAWAEACKFIEKITYQEIKNKDEKYSTIIIETLKKNGYELINTKNNCVNYIISFVHPSIHAHDVNEYLASKNIIIRSGNLCSQNALRKIESNAINRITLGAGITAEDVQVLCKELRRMVQC